MQLVKWNPMRDFLDRHSRANRIFDDLLYPFVHSGGGISVWGRMPAVDTYDSDENIVIKAELPGVDKKDIAIDVEKGVLTLKAERTVQNEVGKENYYCKERSSGRFVRRFALPENVDPEKIKAEYKDGVLKIEIFRPEERKPRKVSVH